MMKLHAPKGVSQVTVETQNFKVSKDGYVVVPENLAPKLIDIGFTGASVIEVSAETAAAIKNTARAASGGAAAAPAPADRPAIAE